MFTISSTALLFFYHVRAIFNHSMVVKAFFGFIWVALSGLGVLIPISIGGAVSLSTSLISNKNVHSTYYAHFFCHIDLAHRNNKQMHEYCCTMILVLLQFEPEPPQT
jgi:hypothetical protein